MRSFNIPEPFHPTDPPSPPIIVKVAEYQPTLTVSGPDDHLKVFGPFVAGDRGNEVGVEVRTG